MDEPLTTSADPADPAAADDRAQRSSSLGARPRPKKLFTSRAQSAAEASLDVRCACQFYETTLLLPDHINPYGSANDLDAHSRPSSRNAGTYGQPADSRPASPTSYSNEDGGGGAMREHEPHCALYPQSVSAAAASSPYPTLEQELQAAAASATLIVQRDVRQSKLLQRRTPSASRPPSLSNVQLNSSLDAMMQSTADQSAGAGVAALCMSTMMDNPNTTAATAAAPMPAVGGQRSASSSSILRRRLSEQQLQQQQQSMVHDAAVVVTAERSQSQQDLLAAAFVPLKGSAPLSGSAVQVHSTGPYRGPYPGEAYPIDYTLQAKLDSIERQQEQQQQQQQQQQHQTIQPPVGNGQPGQLENTLVRGRSIRYAVNDEAETTRGRSRKEKYQRQSEKRKARKQEERDADERRERERNGKDDEGVGGAGGGAASASALVRSLTSMHQNEDPVQENKADSKQPPTTTNGHEKKPTPPPTSVAQSAQEEKITEQPKPPPLAAQPQTKQAVAEPKLNVEAEPDAAPPTAAPKITEYKQISTTANTLVASLFHSAIVPPTPKPAEPDEAVLPNDPHYSPEKWTQDDPYFTRNAVSPPPPLQQQQQRTASHVSLNRIEATTGAAEPSAGSRPTPMRQRDPSQSSLVRKRYSVEPSPSLHVAGSMSGSQQQLPAIMRQRDPSQSSMLRKRYSTETTAPAGATSQEQLRSQSQSSAQREPLDAEHAQRSASVLMRQRDPSQSSILRQRMAGSQQSLQSAGNASGSLLMRQKDLSTSKLLQKRGLTQSVERETLAPVAKQQPEAKMSRVEREDRGRLEQEDQFDVKRDHEYEPINDPSTSGADASASASVYEPIQDPNDVAAAADDVDETSTAPPTAEGPRRKSFIDSAGDRTRQIRASISSQAGALRSKLQSLKRPGRSASREQPSVDADAGDASMEVDTHDTTADMDISEKTATADEEIVTEMQVDESTVTEAAAPKEPTKSRAALNKLKSVQMPKLRKPQFKRPEFTKKLKAPDFKMRMPERPAFTRAETYNFRFRKQASAPEADAAADELRTQRSASEEPPQRKARSPKAAKGKRFDFGTYPRIFQRLRKQSQPDAGGTDFSTTASVSRGNDSQDTEDTGDVSGGAGGGGRRKLGPITFGTFPRMGRRSILTTSTEQSAGSAHDTSSVRTDQFEPMRDESVERRISERLHQAMATGSRSADAGSELGADDSALDRETGEPTAEQRQLAEYDEENREIHQISKAREGEFRQRRPLKHQESDVTSEAETGAWEATSGRRKTRMEEEWERTVHGGHDEEEEAAAAEVERHEPERPASVDMPADFEVHHVELDTDRLSTQETQSSGSSGYMRRKGVIDSHEHVDGHSDYLHSDHDLSRFESGSGMLGGSKASTDRMEGGFYGSGQQADSFDSAEKYDRQPQVPGRRRQRSKQPPATPPQHPEDLDDLSDSLRHSRHFDEYPDDSDAQLEGDEKVADLQAKVDEYEDEFERLFFKHQQHLDDYRAQHGDALGADEQEEDEQNILMASLDRVTTPPLPPVAPRRRKHKSMDRAATPQADASLVYRTEHEYPDTATDAQPTDSLPPVPLARTRSTRSRSQNSWAGYVLQDSAAGDHHSISDVDSLQYDAGSGRYVIDMKETNGYAVVRKEPPPRPPAPLRQRGSSRSLSGSITAPGAARFSTMPHMRTRPDASNVEDDADATASTPLPERPTRNYHTIGPSRPPRRTSSFSLGETKSVPSQSHPDLGGQYEEIEHFQHQQQLQQRHTQPHAPPLSMQHRPLPPPPRPPRERRSLTRRSTDPTDSEHDATIAAAATATAHPALEDVSRISSQDMEEIEEVEVACQTDPTADGVEYRCDSFDQDTDAVLAPSAHLLLQERRRSQTQQQTLEHVLKQEQQAELDRARQLADAQQLTRGLQRYRDANQRSYSERSQDSLQQRPLTPSSLVAAGSRPGSRPQTPSAALLVEKRLVISTTETDAALIVRPLPLPLASHVGGDVGTDDEDYDHRRWLSLARAEAAAEDTADTEDERIVKEALRRYHLLSEDSSVDKDGGEQQATTSAAAEQRQPPMEPVHEDATAVPPTEAAVDELEEVETAQLPQQHGITDEEKWLGIEPAPIASSTPTADQEPTPILTEAHVELAHEEVTTIAELPQAPPRRRDSAHSPPASTAATEVASGTVTISEVLAAPSLLAEQQLLLQQQIQLQQQLIDGRLHLAELEVDQLNVGALQAQRIQCSDLQTMATNTQELECKSGQLVVRGIELPAGFIEDLVDRVRTTERRALEEAAAGIVQLAQEQAAAQAAAAAAAVEAARPVPVESVQVQTVEETARPVEQAPPVASSSATVYPTPPAAAIVTSAVPIQASASLVAASHFDDSQSEPDVPEPVRSHSPATPRRRRHLNLHQQPSPLSQHHMQQQQQQPHHPSLYQTMPASFMRRRSEEAEPFGGEAGAWSSGDEEILLPSPPPQMRHRTRSSSQQRSAQRSTLMSAPQLHQQHQQQRDQQIVRPSSPVAQPQLSSAEQASVAELAVRLVRACGTAVGRSAGQVVASVRAIATKTEQTDAQRSDANVGLIILIFIVAVILMLGMGGGPGRAIHTHHWDFYNPPENEGRK